MIQTSEYHCPLFHKFDSLLDAVHGVFCPRETIHNNNVSPHERTGGGQVGPPLALNGRHYDCLNVPAIINERSNENVTLDTATFSFTVCFNSHHPLSSCSKETLCLCVHTFFF